MQMRNSQTYLLGLSQNQMPCGSTLVNLATDWKISCNSGPNSKLFALALQIISVSMTSNYNDVVSTTDSLEFVNVTHFTDV